jgi:site-specific recombinase XerC
VWELAAVDVEPADVRELFGKMRQDGKSTSAIRKLRAALSAMFTTAVEDGLLRSNPARAVRVPAGRAEEPGEKRSGRHSRERS